MADETKPQDKPAEEKPKEGAAPPGSPSAPQAPLPEGAALRDGPAWEKREALGLVNAVIETIKAVALKPAETFETMKREGGLQNPLIYAFLMGALSFLGGLVYGVFKTHAIGQLCGGLVFAAIIGVVGPFISAGIIHIMLKLLGAQKHGFEVTYRTVCYAMSPNVIGLVPVSFLGLLVGQVWSLVCIIIGLTKTQECTTKTAVLAVVIPAAVLVCFCVGAIFLVGGALMAMIMGSAAAAQQTY